MKPRVAAALALVALVVVPHSAHAGTAAGPELDVGTVTAGPTNALPVPVFACDSQGTLMLFKDERVPWTDEATLYAQRFDDAGNPLGSEQLIAWRVGEFVPIETGDRVLVLWTSASAPSTGPVQSAFIAADGAPVDAAPAVGLGALPTSAACRTGSCTLCMGYAFVRLDLATRTAGASFDIAPPGSLAAGTLALATHGDGSFAVRAATTDGPLWSALLAADDSVVEPYTLLPLGVLEPQSPVLVRGDSGYLLGVFDGGTTSSLVLAPLGADGGLLATQSESPLQIWQTWAATYAGGAYRVLLSGSPPQFSVLTEQSASTPVAVPLGADGAVTSIRSLEPSGTELLASFGPPNPTVALGDPPAPQIARLTLDGAVESTTAVGERPSQAVAPSLAASGDHYLLTYQEYAAQEAPILHYSVLDANGVELGRAGTLAGNLPDQSPPASDWFSAPADGGGFLLRNGDEVWLVDADANLTPVPLVFPADSPVSWSIPIAGGGVILVLTEAGGNCGEDCAWSDVYARRFALDGSALDGAPLFDAAQDSKVSERFAPSAVWDGAEFVVFSVAGFNAELEFRRVGADGTLIDADWTPLAGSQKAYSYGVAAGDGELLVAFGTDGGVFASRLFADGTSDSAPTTLDDVPPDMLNSVTQSPIEVAYDGSEFLAAWQKNAGVVAVRVTPGGISGGLDTLTDASEPPPHGITLASTGDGRALLGYYRFDEQPSLLTSRIKLRALTSGPAAPGSACALDGDCASDVCSSGVCCGSACSDAGESCSRARTGLADGICAPDAAGPNGNGAGGAPAGCDEHACPPGFTCDATALVCVVPPQPSATASTHGGCGCRTGRGQPASGWIVWVGVALLGLRRRRMCG